MQVIQKREVIVTHVLLILGSLVMLYPFVFAFLGSFLSIDQFYEVGFLPVPTGFSQFWKNFGILLRREEIYASLFVTAGRIVWYTAFVGFTSVLGGYVFAKVRFKGKKLAFYLLMSSMMVPGVALLTPQYLMLARFPLVGGNDITGYGGTGFINSVSVLFVTGMFSAYNIFLLRQSFLSLGNEFQEAADVDGANFFQIVFLVYLPMVKPALAVIFINLFIGQWNDYLFPLIFVSSNPSAYPIGVTSVKIMSEYLGTQTGGLFNYPVVMSTAIVMMIPPVAVYVAFQKYFVTGLTLGGVKS